MSLRKPPQLVRPSDLQAIHDYIQCLSDKFGSAQGRLGMSEARIELFTGTVGCF
jgi:hypothetical protein